MNNIINQINDLIDDKPEICIALGSGLDGFVNKLHNVKTLDYENISGFLQTKVAGHAGQFVYGYINKIPILCGGTGLYIESTLLDYDLSKKPPPNTELRKKLEQYDKHELLKVFYSLSNSNENKDMLLETKKQIIRNIEIIKSKPADSGFKLTPMKDDAIVFATDVDTDLLREKIKQRLIERIDGGMIEEVENLIENGMPIDRLDYFGLEYKFVGRYLKSQITKEEMIVNLTTSIRKFSKRQRTWFRRMEKRGININWVNPDNYQKLKEMTMQYIDES